MMDECYVYGYMDVKEWGIAYLEVESRVTLDFLRAFSRSSRALSWSEGSMADPWWT